MQGPLPLLWAGRVTDVSAVSPTAGGKVDEGPGAKPGARGPGVDPVPGESTQHHRSSEKPMTAHPASAAPVTPARVRTGGPKGDGDAPQYLEHVLGWVLVVVIAMLVTRLGLL
ncbi:hypothetical protein GCM10010524_17620 [Streptomyces mexicanus]